MVYNKQTWENNPPSTATPITAERLDHLETQYDEALAQVAADIADPDSDIGTELNATIVGEVASAAPQIAAAPRTTHDPNAPTGWGGLTQILSKADMVAATGKTSIYEPWVIDTQGAISGAPGRFLLYWSTDHDATTGGIALAYADDPMGPWTIQGTVYTDTTVGNQTETPAILIVGNELIMYYQQAGVSSLGVGSQLTMYATSTDGVTWVRGGVALPNPSTFINTNAHTGYFKPNASARLGYFGFSLIVGGDYGRRALWRSADGIRWMLDRDYFVVGTDLTGNTGLRVSVAPVVFEYRGRTWMSVGVISPASGGATPATSLAYWAPMGDDFRPQPYGWVESIARPTCVFTGDEGLYSVYVTATGVSLRFLES